MKNSVKKRENAFEKQKICLSEASYFLQLWRSKRFSCFSSAGDFSLVTFCPCPALDAGIVEKKVTENMKDLTLRS